MTNNITYKKIIENMARMHVSAFIEKNAEKRTDDDMIFTDFTDMNLGNGKDSAVNTPSFTCNVKVCSLYNRLSNDYRICGYVDEYGMVRISSIYFERDYATKNDDGTWNRRKLEHKSFFVYGEELNGFAFNR